MKALKALVIAMAVLILAGLAVVAITVAKRASAPDERASAPDGRAPAVAPAGVPAMPSPPVAGVVAPGFGETTVAIPPGFAAVEARTEGERLVVRLQAADGRARIVVIDLRSGRTIGTVILRPDPPAAAPAETPAR